MKSHRSTTAAFAVAALVTITLSPSPASACTPRLEALGADWHAASFAPPSKPSQARVVGQNGREITAGQYRFLHGQIRQAHRECQSGQAQSADRRAAHAHGVLIRAAGRDRAPDAPERFVGAYNAFTVID